jgi:hypothetical protein
MKFWLAAFLLMVLVKPSVNAQKLDDDRMKRDIEVAENVLQTLIRQGLNQKMYFGMEIKGTYLPGYGVTFRIPHDYSNTVIWSSGDVTPMVVDRPGSYSYTIRTRDNGDEDEEESEDAKKSMKLKEAEKEKRKIKSDSARKAYYEKIITSAKDFIVDYGDFISQLGANEKIVVTNQGEHRNFYFANQKRVHLSIEGSKADIAAFKQGKIDRGQALAKIKVVNTETVDEKRPDMELLTSIMGRLYQPDLSKTYFTEHNIYYEFLKDYGVIYYMNVYSSNDYDSDRVRMPTQGNEVMDRATRDKKVAELYPKFEQEMKENIVEYGRSLKSLKPEENLVFNVTLTKCKGCNIPSTAEFAVKASVLQDYQAGKIDRNGAAAKVSVKKGANQ